MSALDFIGASTPAPSLDDVRAGRGSIKRGMSGAAVEYVQALTSVVVDGSFGAGTEDAVKKFQSANGLTADGVVGAQTLAALDRLAGGATKGVQKVSMDDSAPTPAQPRPAAKAVAVASPLPSGVETRTEPAWRQYAAYGLGAVALGGLLYAVTR